MKWPLTREIQLLLLGMCGASFARLAPAQIYVQTAEGHYVESEPEVILEYEVVREGEERVSGEVIVGERVISSEGGFVDTEIVQRAIADDEASSTPESDAAYHVREAIRHLQKAGWSDVASEIEAQLEGRDDERKSEYDVIDLGSSEASDEALEAVEDRVAALEEAMADAVEEFEETASDRLDEFGEEAGESLEEFAEGSAEHLEELGEEIEERFEELGEEVEEQVEQFSRAAERELMHRLADADDSIKGFREEAERQLQHIAEASERQHREFHEHMEKMIHQRQEQMGEQERMMREVLRRRLADRRRGEQGEGGDAKVERDGDAPEHQGQAAMRRLERIGGALREQYERIEEQAERLEQQGVQMRRILERVEQLEAAAEERRGRRRQRDVREVPEESR